MGYLDIARQVKEEDDIEKSPHTLIDQTIREINKEWESRALEWIKVNRPEEWGKILAIEGKINSMALGGNIEGLREALNNYRGVILPMVKFLRLLGGRTGNLFEGGVVNGQ